jgi:ABC-type transport system substrate-binding protein
MVEAVAAFWDKVGIKSRVRIFEFNEYLNRLFDRKTRADAIFVVSSNELMDADKSFSAYYKAGGIGSSNTDKELAALIDAAAAKPMRPSAPLFTTRPSSWPMTRLTLSGSSISRTFTGSASAGLVGQSGCQDPGE